MRKILTVLTLSLLWTACENRSQGDEQPIARVFDHYLYQKDIEGLVPDGKSPEDSISIVKSYIDNWVREELILAQAEYNLPVEVETDIDQDVSEYRASRVVYAYERELIREKLDTSISKLEIEEYYNGAKKNFELRDYVLRGNYIKLEKNAPDKVDAISWFAQASDESIEELKDYCFKYATVFILDTSRWIYFKELQKNIGIETTDIEQFLKENKRMEFEDEYYLHLLRIDEYILKDSISPLALEEENIRNIILNQRKQDLVKKMHNQIYKNALKDGKFEVFLKKE